MEGQNESSIYASPPFKFIIDGNPLYIHANLVSLHSKHLDRLMNDHMAEAQKEFAILEDVDEQTFVRFIQWAYNGYYSPPTYDIIDDVLVYEGSKETEGATADSTADLTAEDVPVPEPLPQAYEPAPEPWPEADEPYNDGLSFAGFGGRKASKKGKKKEFWNVAPPVEINERSSKDALKESFIERKTTVRQDTIAIPPPRPNQDPREDYSNVFLSHARLHVFADKYDIQALKLLALEELQTTLAIFTLYSERTGDIVELLRYIYENTRESVRGVEDLRTLMTHYVGIEMDTLIKDGSFKGLMIGEGGALLGDFLSMVGKRI